MTTALEELKALTQGLVCLEHQDEFEQAMAHLYELLPQVSREERVVLIEEVLKLLVPEEYEQVKHRPDWVHHLFDDEGTADPAQQRGQKMATRRPRKQATPIVAKGRQTVDLPSHVINLALIHALRRSDMYKHYP